MVLVSDSSKSILSCKLPRKTTAGPYSAIRVFHVFGVLFVAVGVILALMGAYSAYTATGYGGGGFVGMILAAPSGGGIIVAGVFNIVFAKMAEASVHTAEMTQH